MATIKSYTDLQQSKKLAEILPLESADMHSEAVDDEGDMVFIVVDGLGDKTKPNYGSPVWSLAALLGVIPKRIKHYNVLTIDISENEFAIRYDEIAYRYSNDLPDITKDNPVDACVAMIERLHELNLL